MVFNEKLEETFDGEKFAFKKYYYKKSKNLVFNKDKICLLDMRGKSILKNDDKKTFDAFVFGGILGDHPPKDRTSQLR